MNSNTVLSVVVIGGVAVVGYLIYKHYNPTASRQNNTVLTDVGFGLQALPGVISAAQSIFGHSSDSSGYYDSVGTGYDSVG